MVTRRARERCSIARVAILGALALAVLFGAVALGSITTSTHASDPQHAVVISRDAKTNVVAATSARSRGSAWVASLVSTVGGAALAAHLIRADRRSRARRKLQQFSIRLRAPPHHLLVAH